MAILGVDVSEMQPPDIPLQGWFDGGARIIVVRASIGFREDPGYESFVKRASLIGYSVGAYHALLGHQFYDPVRQARDFIGLIMPQVAFVALDIEAPGTSRADVAAFVATYQAEGPGLPLLLYGNAALETLLGAGAYPALGLWYADYGDGLVTSTPRPGTPRRINVGAFRGHQFAGNNGRLAPYTGQIDLTNWEQSPTEGNDMPITLTDAQVKQFVAVLDDLTLHLSQIKSQAAAWQTYAQAEADYILTLRPLLVLTPPPTGNWWDSLPAGVFPKPVAYPAQPNPYKIYDQAGVALATVKPRMNAGQFFERHGDLLRVLDTPISGALWWVRAEELTTTLGPVG